MKQYIPSILMSVTLISIAWILDFKIKETEAPVQQVVKKVVVVKKIYIKIPSDTNQTIIDTIQLVTPAAKNKNDYQNFKRSRFMHKPGPIS
ncbi:MAG: hypothetical protein MUF42_09225 [Cytophagaceae bacterium]|jgi:hypothetical protein|nr:hypothetical protein [Cytophagaceae bacterium]